MVLALRLGTPVALFGMVGGFLTPLCSQQNRRDFVGLFSYLIVLYAGLQLVLSQHFRNGWVYLSFPLTGVFIWALLALTPLFQETVLSWLCLFLVCQLLPYSRSVAILQQQGQYSPLFNRATYTQYHSHSGEVPYFSSFCNLNPFRWDGVTISFLLSAGIIGLAYLRPGLYTKVMMGKLFSDILLLAIYLPQTDITSGILVALGLLGLYVAPAAFILAAARSEKPWAITQVAAALGVYIV